MLRTLNEATDKRFQYDIAADLEDHVHAAVAAYNFARRFKGLRWRTPFQAVCDAWVKDPSRFKADPHRPIAGPYT